MAEEELAHRWQRRLYPRQLRLRSASPLGIALRRHRFSAERRADGATARRD